MTPFDLSQTLKLVLTENCSIQQCAVGPLRIIGSRSIESRTRLGRFTSKSLFTKTNMDKVYETKQGNQAKANWKRNVCVCVCACARVCIGLCVYVCLFPFTLTIEREAQLTSPSLTSGAVLTQRKCNIIKPTIHKESLAFTREDLPNLA